VTLKNILAAKHGAVLSIEPTADLAAAARLLNTHRVGVVVILGADHRVAGILSERDIIRELADRGNAALELPVAQAMTCNVSTCEVDDSVGSVLERMTMGKFRHMPVLDKNQLVGLVSLGDLVKENIETIREHLQNLDLCINEFNMLRL
jgi:CBS domain-containing protein